MNALRRIEMEQLLPVLPPGARILEFGAGTGQQAQFLADHGFNIIAIDLANSNYASQRTFPIKDYDGEHVPLEDQSIDIIFSSNVLEHVENLPTIFAELRRILRPNGFCLHVLPTPAWRLWSFATSLAASLAAAATLPADLWQPRGESRSHILKRGLRRIASGFVPRGHGTSAEGLSELWTFSRLAWRRRFEKHGFEVVEDRPMGVFYTGTQLLGASLSLPKRRLLARIFGSATHVYRVKARSGTR